MTKKIIYIILFMIPTLGFAQSEAKLIRKGNKDYKGQDYKAAEVKYRKSLEQNNKSVKGEFNLADALYEQEDYENAAKLFQDLVKKDMEPLQKSEVFHNLGNTFLETEKYQESIEAYKNALRNNPTDLDSKYNLEYARQKLKEQQEQEKKDEENKDQNKDQEDKEDQKDQEKQDQDKDQDKDQNKDQDKKDEDKDQDQKDQEKDKDQDQNKDQQNKKQQQQPKQISKKDAERMLSALKNDEKKTIEKLKKAKAKAAKASKTEKDW